MGVYARKTLRQALGRWYLRDTIVGNAANTLAAAAPSFYLMDTKQVNLAFSGEVLHKRSHLRVSGEDFRVASFNTASGAFVTLQTSVTALVYSAEYELHRLLSPADKDAALDHIIESLAEEREVPLASVKDQKFYTLPGEIVKVLDVWYWADPTNSLDRKRAYFDHWEVRTTGSGREVRIDPSLAGTEQIIFRATIHASLGAGDAATVNIPDDKWVLYGAESQCWEMLAKDAPGKEISSYLSSAKRAAMKFTQLSSRYGPFITKPIRLDNKY